MDAHPSAGDKQRAGLKLAIAIVVLLLLAAAVYWLRQPIGDWLRQAYHFIVDRERIKAYIDGFGMAAPLVFMAIQVLQVIFAPVPGEATGFIGGYLFGAWKGFCYSSLALAVGSWINFIIGRFLGERYVRRLIPPAKLERFDTYIKRQGILVLLLLYVFPGFPKDYLSLFLGLSALPIKVFLLIAAFGRMPGTLMLSYQGASLYDQNYLMFAILLIICIAAGLVAYILRERIYRWVEKMNATSR